MRKRILRRTRVAIAAAAGLAAIWGSDAFGAAGTFGYGLELTTGSNVANSGVTTLYALDNNGGTRLVPLNSTATLNTSAVSSPEATPFNLGTFQITDSLVLKGGSELTYANSGSTVTQAYMNYRVFASGATPGGFTQVSLPQNEATVAGVSGDTRWSTESLGINLLGGLAPGTYVLGTYGRASDGTNNYYESNNSSNFGLGFTVAALPANTYLWDPARSATGAGGSGTWDVSTASWTIDGNSYSAWSNSSNSTAYFSGSGAAATVAIGANVTAGGLTFGSAGFSIGNGSDAGTLTLINGATINTNGYNATLGIVTGRLSLPSSGTIYKTGVGTLTITNQQTSSSGVTVYVQGGTRDATTGQYSSAIAMADPRSIGGPTGSVLYLDGGQFQFTANGGGGYLKDRQIYVTANGGAIWDGGFLPGVSGGGSTIAPTLTINANGVLDLVSTNVLQFDNAGGAIKGAGGVSVFGAGTVKLLLSTAYTGGTTINPNANLQLGNGTAGNDGSIASTSGVTNNGSLVYNLVGSQTAGYVISGSGSLTKSGSGTLTLAPTSGGNNYAGATTVSGGILLANSSDATNGSTGSGPVVVNASAKLAGTGVIKGTVSLTSGAVISAGGGASSSDATGTLTTGAQTWANGAAYAWKVGATPAAGVAGTNWDLLKFSGLALSLSAGDRVTIYVTSTAALSAFDSSKSYTWQVAQATGGGTISGFNAANFVLDTSGFSQPTNGGTFAVAEPSASEMDVTFTPAPEPSSVGLIGLAAAGLLRRRRQL